MHLVLAGRDEVALGETAAEAHQAGAAVYPVRCDVADEAAVTRLIETGAAINGAINVLVNSAGRASIQPFAECSLDEWRSTLDSGLTGTFLACKHAAGHMPRGSIIVNIASIAARQGIPNWAAYCAAKHGVLGFSNAIREELRPQGVRVAVVLPAATDTPLWDTLPGEWNRRSMLQPADVGLAIAQLVAAPPAVTSEELVIGHVAGML
jgi:NAD(P)-dependent dehydrogenase (short-subunit alcohol dehydrogenase family)